MSLTGYQRSTISNGLRIAAARYAQDARELRATRPAPLPVESEDSDPNFVSLCPISPDVCEKLAQQFDLQYKEALELADLMESETEG